MTYTQDEMIQTLEGVLDELRNAPDPPSKRWCEEQAMSLVCIAREIDPEAVKVDMTVRWVKTGCLHEIDGAIG